MAFIRIPHQRATARWSNNALAIASLKINEIRRPGGGWAPSVLIQGKLPGLGQILFFRIAITIPKSSCSKRIWSITITFYRDRDPDPNAILFKLKKNAI